ncbi:MAG: AMP-binding protein [Kineosporiaceae bacterium]|nr:AMP-binding protein [Aeromicrobium sp.]
MFPQPSASLTGSRRLFDLSTFGDRVALTTVEGELTYSELDERVRETSARLGTTRRLVLIAGANDVETIVAYLAALDGRHPVLLAAGDSGRHLDSTIRDYDPDVVFSRHNEEWSLTERQEGTAHRLHPDLAVLLSTSGSTGSSKLVRLSRDNIRSNALSIADYLGIRPTDRAATTLPVHYCYGLSVVNSHLITGAGLVVTDLSVVDRCFWDLFDRAGATTFAGVPYTFDLLDNCGFAGRDLPQLRYVTQAGGKLSPDRVARFARLGIERDWDFYVMYGQTEATARMAYLPPALACDRPEAIGVPIPGGQFRLDPLPGGEADTGELVYAGSNVMMGYAESPDDLALGLTVTELRTGDIARQDPDGLYEVIGRRSRFAKVFGLRLDLDGLERMLADRGTPALCVAAGDSLYAFSTRRRDLASIGSGIAEHCGIPRRAVHTSFIEREPRTANGKTDFGALDRQAGIIADRRSMLRSTPERAQVSVASLRDLYAELLARPDATGTSSFVSLGGDSLSYVELSVRLGGILGHVPRDWHTRPICELVDETDRPRRRGAFLETSVLLRAVAILLIVGTHANLFTVLGGAHLLLAVAGYNFARFQVSSAPRVDRLRRGLGAIAQIAVPSMIWIGLVAFSQRTYEWKTLFFLNGLLGSDTWTDQWQFWFLETLIWTLAAVVALLAIPWVDVAERASPFGFALGVLAVGLALRYGLTGIESGPIERYMPSIVFWCFALGWAAAKASRKWQRVVVSLPIAATVPGFFGGDVQREAFIVAGMLLLVWLTGIQAPRIATASLGVVASASLFIYLTHWQVYPNLEVDHSLLAVICSLAVGVAYWRASRRSMRRLNGLLRPKQRPSIRVPLG